MNFIFVPFILYTPINEKKHSTGILRKFCGNSAEIRKNPNYSAEFPRNSAEILHFFRGMG